MRDLIRIIETTLAEGVGLSNRIPGEQFKQRGSDHTITFQSLDFYPPSGKFETAEEMQDQIDQLSTTQIQWVNRPVVGGFGIAKFTDDTTGEDLIIGRYFKQISPNPAQNNFPHDAIPGGYEYQSPRATKEKTGYKPSDILTQFENNTPESIYQQIVAKFGEASDITQAAKIFIESDTLPITVPKGDINFTGFRDYFCELLQPIALINGLPITGNAADAEQIFFGNNGYQTCTATFQTGVAGGLFDSLLTNSDGKQIKLSSKGKSGAKASAVNLLNSVNELKITPQGNKLIKKYADVIGILQIIKDQGHTNAPLQLAATYGIITTEEADQVRQLKTYGPADDILGTGILSDNLEGMYQSRKPKDWTKIIPLEHMLSAIAYKVADYVNENTNFSEAASDILNHSALVQMYTEAVESGDTIVIKNFRAVYPSQTVTGVLLDASKSYMSTQSKGNYVFNILKNGATAADIVDNSATTAQAQQRIADLDQKIVDITKPSQGIRPPGTSAPRAERTTPSEPRTKR
jgi:hypothetical protein